MTGLPYTGIGTFLGIWAVVPAISQLYCSLNYGIETGAAPPSITSVMLWSISIASAVVGVAILISANRNRWSAN